MNEEENMHARIAVWCALAVLGAGMLAGAFGQTHGVYAQETTQSGVVPDTALCQAEPRTVDELTAIFAGATPQEPGLASEVSVPIGSPGSAALIEGVTTTLNEAVACLNAGDFLRFLGLLTEHAIVTTFPWIGEELATNGPPPEIENPSPLPSELRQSIVAVAGVSSLGFDRAGAFLVIVDPASGSSAPRVIHLTLLRDGIDWLIDDAIEFNNE
jgi:hypothetical protein